MSNRIVFLDIAKAICIILVVIGHYCPEGCPVWWTTVNNFIYTFHMPLFMFASGFVYMATKRKQESYCAFIIKKLKRLMIPYFSVSALIIGIKLLSESHVYVENAKTLSSFIKMFYYPEAGYFLWFIWALWWMFVIIPFFKSKKQRLMLLALSIFLHYFPIPCTELFCVAQFQNMLIFFMLGVTVYDWKELISIFNQVPKMAYIAVFIVAYIISFKIDLSGTVSLLPYLGIAAVVALSKLIEQSNITKNWMMITSSSSYIIYLLHTTFEGFAKAIVFKVPYLSINNNWTFLIGAAFIVACGVIIPIVLNEKIFKKYSITQVLFGLKNI